MYATYALWQGMNFFFGFGELYGFSIAMGGRGCISRQNFVWGDFFLSFQGEVLVERYLHTLSLFVR